MPLTAYDMTGAVSAYEELTGRKFVPRQVSLLVRLDELSGGRLARWHWVKGPPNNCPISYHGDGLLSASEAKEKLDSFFIEHGFVAVGEGRRAFRLAPFRVASQARGRGPTGGSRARNTEEILFTADK